LAKLAFVGTLPTKTNGSGAYVSDEVVYHTTHVKSSSSSSISSSSRGEEIRKHEL
jgi:hypothetical protein